MLKIKIKLLFIFFISIYANSFATHIVGGTMNYRHLDTTAYEISLYVYRDCYNGIPLFDEFAGIDVFYSNGTYAGYFEIERPNWDTLPVIIDDPCLVAPPNVCVEAIKYLDTVILPYDSSFLLLSYVRCCRNNTILNITTDTNFNQIIWGANYNIAIPMDSIRINNNSPVFKNFPPIGICGGKPFTFDHAAIDSDGDSLVYSLCTPYTGGFPWNPFQAIYPPFDTVVWQEPYSLSNILGGVPLTIDANTGIMNAVPNTIGQFVVGVKVKEYRNGLFLTETIRDFQFNVAECKQIVTSSFFAPTVQCNNFEVAFNNQSSENANTYKWYFGDGDSSDVKSPTHIYADTGTYTVTLIANPGPVCSSTFTQEVNIRIQTIKANFIAKNTACIAQNDTVFFEDKSTDTLTITNWNWQFSNGQNSIKQNPIIIYNNEDSIVATLIVTSKNGCTDTITKTILLYKKPTTNMLDSIEKCKNETIQLPLNISNGNHTFLWTPNINLSNNEIQNPSTNTTINRNYTVKITSILADGNTCIVNDTIQININNNTTKFNLNKDTSICETNFYVYANIENYDSIKWSDNMNFSNILSTNLSLAGVQNQLQKTYYVKAYFGACKNEEIDSIIVYRRNIIYTKNDMEICEGNKADINLNVQTNLQYDIVWNYNDSTFETNNISNISFTPKQSNTLYYNIQNLYGCTAKDSLKITINNLPIINATTNKDTIKLGEIVQLNVTNLLNATYNWQPINEVNNATIFNPTSQPNNTTTYIVELTDSNTCKAIDTVFVFVIQPLCNNENLYIPNAFSPNGDGKNDEFKIRGIDENTEIYFIIYNRWGEKVFETNSIKNTWNGNYKNAIAQPDVYGYYLLINCLDKTKIERKGNITLIR